MAESGSVISGDQLDGLVAVLRVIRAGEARTRPELTRATGLGRTVVTQRLGQLLDAGLVEEGALGRSTGGRAPRELRFRAEAGSVLAAELGATAITVGITDLSGELLAERTETWDVSLGAEATLGRLEGLFDGLMAEGPDRRVLGIGVGLPGPVEFRTGRPVSPPIMPGWDGYPVRDRLTARYRAPTWVDNEVNLMALGELRAGVGLGARDLIYLKMGSGIGAGLVSGGTLHRGAQGCAGDLGHVAVHTGEPPVTCRCGNLNCLEALAGGVALARDGTAAAHENRSEFLAGRLAERPLTAHDVADAAEHGDPVAVELLTRAGRLVGDTLATLVSVFNPAHVVVGGGVAESGDQLLASLRGAVYHRSLPLATRELRITRSSLSHRAGLVGAAHMVTDELFSPARLGTWLTTDAGCAPRPRPIKTPHLPHK